MPVISTVAASDGAAEPGEALMSVTIVVHFHVADADAAVKGLREHAALLEEMTVANKKAGNVRHRVFKGEGELVIIDEWETVAQFEAFFAGNADVEKISAALGVTGPPIVSIVERADVPGTF